MAAVSALIVVDLQNDFMTGGALAVPFAEEVLPPIHELAVHYRHIVLTQDWHPHNHTSFASQHPEKKPFETVTLPYGEQVLWPDHCVQATHGAALHADLQIPHASLIIRKGMNPEVDSYSAFYEADQKTATGLTAYLKAKGIQRIMLVGLATDFCVAYSAIDARAAGFNVSVYLPGCRAIDTEGSYDKALKNMQTAGVNLVTNAGLPI